MKSTKVISRQELEQILLKVKGATFSHVVAFTDESGSRAKDSKKMLQKLTFRNVTLGGDYTNRVNNRIESEVPFVSYEMNGKTFVEGSKIVAFKNTDETVKYLVCDQEKRSKVVTQFFHDGKPIKKQDAIDRDMFSPSYFKEKTTSGRGLVAKEDDFQRLTFSLSNIIAITLNKQKYRIVD